MPQMSPLMWMILYMYFFFIFFFMNVVFYYFKNYILLFKELTLSKINKISFKNKW